MAPDNTTSTKNLLGLAISAANAAANALRLHFVHNAQVTDSQNKDIKTKADLAAQAVIVSTLAPSGIPTLAEEGDSKQLELNNPVWLIDPLDGTLNFARGFEMAAVSIGLWDKREPVLGVVHDIYQGYVYAGVVSEGCLCNRTPINVSSTSQIEHAVLATGFPSGRSYDTDDLLSFVTSVQSYKKVRMLGCASLMLAHVAAGHFDAYEEEDIYIWDVAAGLGLIRAAGGNYVMKAGTGAYKYHVRATNGRI